MTSQLHVEKFGTNLVAGPTGVNQANVSMYVEGFIDRFLERGDGLVVVTSGALALGQCIAAELGYEEGKLTNEQKSGMGFAPMFMAWQEEFARHNIAVATTGITPHQLGIGRWYHRIANRQERRLFASTIRQNSESKVVTILNEPDMVSNKELMALGRAADNDGSAAQVSIVVGADTFTIWTKNGGVYDDDKELVDTVDGINFHPTLRMLQSRGKSEAGRGGMDSKVRAARRPALHGISSRICAPNIGMEGVKVTRVVR